MFSYAAKSILSRTLRRILQKYLINVDIETIALGGDDGWGIKIKNVQLKEGAVLWSRTTLVGDDEFSKKNSESDNESKNEFKRCEFFLSRNPYENDRERNEETLSFDDEASQSGNFTKEKWEETEENGERLTGNHGDEGDVYFSSGETSEEEEYSPSMFCYRRPSKEYEARKVLRKKRKNKASKGTVEMDIANGACEDNDQYSGESKSTERKQNDSHLDDRASLVERKTEIRIGKGGVFGDLEVKYYENEIHITVLDADVSLEVVTTYNASNDTGAHKSPPNSTDATQEREIPSSNDNGSKVEEDSYKSLIKMIVGIPEILLSNCKVCIVFIDHAQCTKSGFSMKSTDEPLASEKSDKYADNEYQYMIDIGVDFFFVGDNNKSKDNINANSLIRKQTTSYKKFNEIGAIDSYIYKNIRIGDGRRTLEDDENILSGFWIKVLQPKKCRQPNCNTSMESVWARSIWKSRVRPLLNVVGFSTLIRVNTESLRKEEEERMREGMYYSDSYDDFAIDSMLGGWVVSTSENDDTYEYTEESNQVKFECVKSNFHRVARGLRRRTGQSTDPLLDDSSCWLSSPSKSSSSGNQLPHLHENPMDQYIPKSGIAIFAFTLDPIEVNVERSSLEVISKLIDILGQSSPAKNTTVMPRPEGSPPHGSAQEKTSLNDMQGTSSFPTFMQPDNVLVCGVHLDALIFRIQMLREYPWYEDQYGFRYTEVLINNVCFDFQSLKSSEMIIDDMMSFVDCVNVRVWKGICNQMQQEPIGTLGETYEEPEKESPLRATHSNKNNRSMRYSAFIILKNNIHERANITRAIKKCTMKGVQFRYFHCVNNEAKKHDSKCFELKLGQFRLKVPSTLPSEFALLSNEAKNVLKMPEGNDKQPPPKKFPIRFSWNYNIRFEGGTLQFAEMFHAVVPTLDVAGLTSPTAGFFFESVLSNIHVQYSRLLPGCIHTPSFLPMLISLPETVRMNILLFLGDLDLAPLAEALRIRNISKSESSFLACYVINKSLSNNAEFFTTLSTKKRMVPPSSSSSPARKTATSAQVPQCYGNKEEMLKRLASLDNIELVELLRFHEKRKMNHA